MQAEGTEDDDGNPNGGEAQRTDSGQGKDGKDGDARRDLPSESPTKEGKKADQMFDLASTRSSMRRSPMLQAKNWMLPCP